MGGFANSEARITRLGQEKIIDPGTKSNSFKSMPCGKLLQHTHSFEKAGPVFARGAHHCK